MALISSPPYFQPSHLDSISAQRLNLRQKIQKKQGKPCYSEYLDQHTTTKKQDHKLREPCSFPHCNALMVDKAVTNVLFSFNLKKEVLIGPPWGVAIRTYWPPLGGANKNLLAPPRGGQ